MPFSIAPVFLFMNALISGTSYFSPATPVVGDGFLTGNCSRIDDRSFVSCPKLFPAKNAGPLANLSKLGARAPAIFHRERARTAGTQSTVRMPVPAAVAVLAAAATCNSTCISVRTGLCCTLRCNAELTSAASCDNDVAWMRSTCASATGAEVHA